MDRDQLIDSLKGFVDACAKAGRPIADICLEDSYGGSYILQVKAKWMDDLACYPILEFLTNKLFETTDEAIRSNIFYIKVLDMDDKFHCFGEVEGAKTSQATIA
ncbi:MAG: hypothetical protein ABIR66_04550 [Saprospiraceae bacterium]